MQSSIGKTMEIYKKKNYNKNIVGFYANAYANVLNGIKSNNKHRNTFSFISN